MDILTSKGNRSITCDEEVAYGERPVEQQELTAGVTSRRINFLLHEYRNRSDLFFRPVVCLLVVRRRPLKREMALTAT